MARAQSKSKPKPKPKSKTKPATKRASKPSSKPKAKTKPKPAALSPRPISELIFSYAPSRILSAGVQLGVFSHIASGQHTADEIAAAEQVSPRGMRMLLDALVGMKLLAKAKGNYSLTPLSEKFLVRQSPDYMAAMIENDALWQGWTRLTDVIRSGSPLVRVEEQDQAEKFFSILVRSLHVMNREPGVLTAKAVLKKLKKSGPDVVDVACGSGVWGIAFAEADPKARITFQDFAGVLNVTREYAERHGVGDRAEYLAGDLKTVDYGENRFDAALLGNIVHSEGEASSRDLFRRLHQALRPGGRIVIIDMVPNDERTGPVFPLIFALNMFIHTQIGDTYTLGEYTAWLKDAGFSRVEAVDIGGESPLIVGVKS